MFVVGARHLRIVGAAKVAKVRAPLPLSGGGGGVGGEGDGGSGTTRMAPCHVPLSPTLSLRGRGSQTEPSWLSPLLHQAFIEELDPMLHDKRRPALQMRHATNIGCSNLRRCASGQCLEFAALEFVADRGLQHGVRAC